MSNPSTVRSMRLQWGHSDEAVEDIGDPLGSGAERWLQWGHGDEAVEDPDFP